MIPTPASRVAAIVSRIFCMVTQAFFFSPAVHLSCIGKMIWGYIIDTHKVYCAKAVVIFPCFDDSYCFSLNAKAIFFLAGGSLFLNQISYVAGYQQVFCLDQDWIDVQQILVKGVDIGYLGGWCQLQGLRRFFGKERVIVPSFSSDGFPKPFN